MEGSLGGTSGVLVCKQRMIQKLRSTWVCRPTFANVSPIHFSSKPREKCSATSQLSNALNSRDVAIPPRRRPTCRQGGKGRYVILATQPAGQLTRSAGRERMPGERPQPASRETNQTLGGCRLQPRRRQSAKVPQQLCVRLTPWRRACNLTAAPCFRSCCVLGRDPPPPGRAPSGRQNQVSAWWRS